MFVTYPPPHTHTLTLPELNQAALQGPEQALVGTTQQNFLGCCLPEWPPCHFAFSCDEIAGPKLLKEGSVLGHSWKIHQELEAVVSVVGKGSVQV